MQITLKQDPDFYTKAKDGRELSYINKKTGKPTAYKKVRIHSSEHEKPLWGAVFDNQSPIINWKGGQMVEIEVEESGDYLNFKIPQKGAFNFGPRIVALEERVAKLEAFILQETEPKSDSYEADEISASEIPF